MTTEKTTSERMDEKELRALLARMAHALPIEAWSHGQRIIEEELERARSEETRLAAELAEEQSLVATLRDQIAATVAEWNRDREALAEVTKERDEARAERDSARMTRHTAEQLRSRLAVVEKERDEASRLADNMADKLSASQAREGAMREALRKVRHEISDWDHSREFCRRDIDCEEAAECADEDCEKPTPHRSCLDHGCDGCPECACGKGSIGLILDEAKLAALSSEPLSPAETTRCEATFEGERCELDARHSSHHRHSQGPTVGGSVLWADLAETTTRGAPKPKARLEIERMDGSREVTEWAARCGDQWEGWSCALVAGHKGDHHDGPATWQAGPAPTPAAPLPDSPCRCGAPRCAWSMRNEPRPPGPPPAVHSFRIDASCPACRSTCAHGPAGEPRGTK